MHEIKTEVDDAGELTMKKTSSGRRRNFAMKNEDARKTALLSVGEQKTMKKVNSFHKSVQLKKKNHIDFSTRYPITEEILEALRQFTMNEAILDPNDIKNILIAGGGSLMQDFSLKRSKHDAKAHETTIGEQIRMDLSEVLELQGLAGIEVKCSADPQRCVL